MSASPAGPARSRRTSAPLVEGELKFLEANWPRGLPEGVIHADLFPDNVFFLGDRLSGLIDFYFACNDALAYDIAVCLNAWCFEKDMSFNITKGQAFLRGYEEVRQHHSGGARGDADARPRGRVALPADARLRLAEHTEGRTGQPQESDRVSCAACASTRACARSPSTASSEGAK